VNEIAERSNAGTHVLDRLSTGTSTVSADATQVLARVAFKMATGSGKTVVMACISSITLEPPAISNDTRTRRLPGHGLRATIREPVAVLLVDTSTRVRRDALDTTASDAGTVAIRRRSRRPQCTRVITNYHAFSLASSRQQAKPLRRKAERRRQEAGTKRTSTCVLSQCWGTSSKGGGLLI